MSRTVQNVLALTAATAVWLIQLPRPDGASPVAPAPVPIVKPTEPKHAPILPWRRPTTIDKFLDGTEPICPFDPAVSVVTDLPQELRLHNTGGMGRGGPGTGAGLCVFTSIEHAANWANEQRLSGFQKKMTHEPGGGSPGKVDQMIAKYAPGVAYIQHTSGDANFLKAVLKTGRMPCITYAGRDPFYNNQKIYHMVNLVYLDDQYGCILDNNREKVYVWMTAQELLDRWRDAGGGWSVALLAPPPPPPPHN